MKEDQDFHGLPSEVVMKTQVICASSGDGASAKQGHPAQDGDAFFWVHFERKEEQLIIELNVFIDRP